MWPGEAAKLAKVSPRTLARYADDGRLPVAKTPGGRRRYLRSDVLALITLGRPA